MTEFRSINTGEFITTKNNMNNVQPGHYIEVNKTNGKTANITGIVKSVNHIVNVWHNSQGLERSSHDIEIVINEMESKGD